MLSRLKYFLPQKILKMIYNSLFLAHLNYGITAWGFNSCKRLVNLQKKAIRIISRSKYLSHTSPLFRQLNLLKLDDLFKLACCKFLYKNKNNTLPTYFNNFLNNLPIQEDRAAPRRISNIPSRFDDTLHNIPNFSPRIKINLTNTKTSRLCIRHKIPDLINENYLPQIVLDKVDTHSLKGFTEYAKNYIIDNYSSVCTVHNCFVCNNNAGQSLL